MGNMLLLFEKLLDVWKPRTSSRQINQLRSTSPLLAFIEARSPPNLCLETAESVSNDLGHSRDLGILMVGGKRRRAPRIRT